MTIINRIINEKGISLTDISDEFSMEEIAYIAKILAKYHDVKITKNDAQEYIDVINQEYEEMKIKNLQSARPQDIKDYLQKLKSQKK